jgi:hypothetical protein
MSRRRLLHPARVQQMIGLQQTSRRPLEVGAIRTVSTRKANAPDACSSCLRCLHFAVLS